MLNSLKEILFMSENTLEMNFYILSLIQHILFPKPFSNDVLANYFIL